MKLIMIEISVATFILLIISAMSFLLLRSKIDYFYSEKTAYEKIQFTLHKKQEVAQSDIAVKKLLHQWQQKHPDFYHALSGKTTSDQIIVSLTQVILQSGFQILQNKSAHFVLIGKYLDLFYLIYQIDRLPWPITMTQVSIQSDAHFTITFLIGTTHD